MNNVQFDDGFAECDGVSCAEMILVGRRDGEGANIGHRTLVPDNRRMGQWKGTRYLSPDAQD